MLIRISVALMVLFATSLAVAQPHSCKTPRSAVSSLFDALQSGERDPQRASVCFQADERMSAELGRLAVQLKALFDSRGLYVDLGEVPSETDYVDPDSGRSEYTVHADLRGIVVARQSDGRWLWTSGSLARGAILYRESFQGVEAKLIRKIPPSLKGTVFDVALWQYLALFLVFVLGLAVRKVIQFVVTSRIRRLAETLGQAWASRVVDVFASPGATLVMAAMLWISYPRLRLPLAASMVVGGTVRVMVVVSIVWAAYRVVDVLAERMAIKAASTESKLDDQLVPLVRKSLKVFTVLAGSLFILQNLSVNVGSLLAGLGIGGVAVALAAKDTIANFFGSVMIFVDRPFQIGDWVVVDGTEGIIEEVGFRSTRIRTFYNSLVTVPNAKFTEAHIDNYGARRYRRSFFTLNLTYDTTPEQMQAFVEGIRGIVQANEYSRKDYYEIHMCGFGAHSLDVMVYFFFEVSSWSEELRERHNVMLEIMRLAEELGVSFAFPTQTLHVDSLAAMGAERRVPPPHPTDKLVETLEAFGPEGSRARPRGPTLSHGYFAGALPKREGQN